MRLLLEKAFRVKLVKHEREKLLDKHDGEPGISSQNCFVCKNEELLLKVMGSNDGYRRQEEIKEGIRDKK